MTTLGCRVERKRSVSNPVLRIFPCCSGGEAGSGDIAAGAAAIGRRTTAEGEGEGEEGGGREMERLIGASVERESDAKETLILVRNHQDQFIETAKDAKETLVLAQKNSSQLTESVKDGKETLELARKYAEQSARDGKETLLLARKTRRLLKQIERMVTCTSKVKYEPETSRVLVTPTMVAAHNRNTDSYTTRVTGTSLSEEETSTFRSKDDDHSIDGHIFETSNLRDFKFAELKIATRNFSPDVMIGEGGFGRVFKGWLDKMTLSPSKPDTGMAVAIKKLKQESLQGIEEWQTEVNFAGRLSHPNIVKLLGYCWEKKELLLVYEFIPKGSLQNHLFRRISNLEPLSWETRIKVAIGAGQGLSFLHSLEKQVIFRDFKTSHVLLDGNYTAKLSDFGLAKLGPNDGNSHVSTRVVGTYGYAAPEYVATGHLNVKSDVYSFGVVLLEILTGLRVLDTSRPKEQVNLVDWAKPFLSSKKKLKKVKDVRMEGQYSLKAAFKAGQLTLNCLASELRNRPCMKEVVEELEQILAIKKQLSPTSR